MKDFIKIVKFIFSREANTGERLVGAFICLFIAAGVVTMVAPVVALVVLFCSAPILLILSLLFKMALATVGVLVFARIVACAFEYFTKDR